MANHGSEALDFVGRWYEQQPVRERPGIHGLLRDAALVRAFLAEQDAAILILDRGPIHWQSGGVVASPPPERFGMPTIQDDQQYSVTVSAVDSKNQDVAVDAVTATSSDEAVATVTGSAPDFTVVGGNPGTATITYTDGTVSATEEVTVTTGPVATISIVDGAVTDQAAPAPVVAP